MRRIYFFAPDVASAKAIVNDLLLARIEERHIHVLAREGTPLEDLPAARLAQRSDLIPSLERGAAVGGLMGVLAGLVAITFPPAGLVLGGGAVVTMTLLGTGFGAWAASMIGVGIPSSRLAQFESAIAGGELLVRGASRLAAAVGLSPRTADALSWASIIVGVLGAVAFWAFLFASGRVVL